MFPPENFPYHIERKVGEGAMGAVYAAIDPDLNRRVAIKVMHPGNPDGAEETHLRFLQEARAAAALSHPGVTVIYRIGEEAG
jgi:serine/threonine protein kinase